MVGSTTNGQYKEKNDVKEAKLTVYGLTYTTMYGIMSRYGVTRGGTDVQVVGLDRLLGGVRRPDFISRRSAPMSEQRIPLARVRLALKRARALKYLGPKWVLHPANAPKRRISHARSNGT